MALTHNTDPALNVAEAAMLERIDQERIYTDSYPTTFDRSTLRTLRTFGYVGTARDFGCSTYTVVRYLTVTKRGRYALQRARNYWS